MAVALTYNSVIHALMMATPSDLEDFAIGFSLSEGIIADPDEVESLEIVSNENGPELRMWIAEPRPDAFTDRRRYLVRLTGYRPAASSVRPKRCAGCRVLKAICVCWRRQSGRRLQS